jgi:hypothetical protein
MEITRIFGEDDGTSVEVASGFDPAAVRLTGNVHGQPPFRGVLQHGGWRAEHVTLPKTAGVDAAILAPRRGRDRLRRSHRKHRGPQAPCQHATLSE